jgi:tRNA(Ile)-lysidine synthase TilS/MesJ
MDVLLPKSGRYVVAISGGVDSVTLLDILVKHRDLKLTIAHVDHGIRTDSVVDRTLVESQAGTQNVPRQKPEKFAIDSYVK